MILSLACFSICTNKSDNVLHNDLELTDRESKYNADDILSPIIDEAKWEEKNIFLIFGSPTCSPCRRFEKFLQDSSVNTIISKYFIVNTFDVIRTTKGKELYKMYWQRGMPSWILLDKQLVKIAESTNPSTGTNIGYPVNARDLAYFEYTVRKGAPEITNTEIKVLRERIITYSPAKDQY